MGNAIIDGAVAALSEKLGGAGFDGSAKFVQDFVGAWNKVMELGRFDS